MSFLCSAFPWWALHGIPGCVWETGGSSLHLQVLSTPGRCAVGQLRADTTRTQILVNGSVLQDLLPPPPPCPMPTTGQAVTCASSDGLRLRDATNPRGLHYSNVLQGPIELPGSLVHHIMKACRSGTGQGLGRGERHALSEATLPRPPRGHRPGRSLDASLWSLTEAP